MHRDNVISTDVLLHSCCGPCSTTIIERLAPDFNITVFFYNPCITDRHEYEKRKENQKKLIRLLNGNPEEGKKPIGFIEGDYDVENYFEDSRGKPRLIPHKTPLSHDREVKDLSVQDGLMTH